ncbi:BREX-2 system adenine-specific DNA-methyltransferase PglX [Micromonospora sp. WMMD1102]|uniref:BREX-2 system adenine-specific DNA-methyltransferase PglX n=1 Tax=Micromonospora sp. WMMD1102 TaxID=3016105 RepID=UPI0024156F27|nr:BREX-2 system adenine-specific DNA-methyltransferase PglX [Micromonospora sp. WMMD1102]MDG4789083.1 BREX-2 system adenine-specific DNA-methyltransferase PglX [Micromonospora sp. WMMD1102]
MIELKALQDRVKDLTDDLRRQVGSLVNDLRGQVADEPALRAELRQEYAQAKTAERVAASFETWLEDILDQAAVAWVLGCVFVRFCEDNELVNGLWIGGAEPAALAERAMQHRQAHLIANPRHNDREWLREAFGYLRGLRATGKIFDQHNPVWRFPISGPAAEELSDFFRRGAGRTSLRDPELNTRFLGDLYQDLSAHAKKTYALLQTPEFVEEFILDRTFEPAVKEFGLPATSVIDPTCGSGHFLLGAFHRLVRKWQEREPATDIGVLVERALGQVTGVDINPFAVAIARFRLLVAGMKLRGVPSLERTPAWQIRVATGDSLLPWGETSRAQGDMLALLEDRPVFAYESEDGDLLADYLRPGQYTVVVGNPPYIVVADAARNQLYRRLYDACSGKYALTVPFAQRFFALAKRGDHDGHGAGHVGQITGNAFMKREFGRKIINEFFAGQVELTEVIDASGAYIPGHGTPTVILIGSNRFPSPRYSGPIRAVLGVRGEPTTPELASEGKVWGSIIDLVDQPGAESEWVSIVDFERAQLATHPWSLSGGGAGALMATIEDGREALHRYLNGQIGFASFPGQDDAFFASPGWFRRQSIDRTMSRPLVIGEVVRDWGEHCQIEALTPYDASQEVVEYDPSSAWGRHLWTCRRVLGSTTGFGGETRADSGEPWWTWYRWVPSRYRTPMSVSFAFVATHNHFVLGRGGKVFNRSAPVIKLPEGATEDDHLRLLGVLNSSTACFWLKQVSQPKGGTANSSGGGNRLSPEPWYERYEFTGTKLEQFSLPQVYPLELARDLDGLAQRLGAVAPAAVAASGVPSRQRFAEAKAEYDSIRAQMIARQEELDWEVYRLYGLIDEELTHPDPPELRLGERAFEIVMAANKVQTEWFNRHGSTPMEKPRDDWPADYRALVERRIAVIGSNRHIGLLERPECKRRWATKSWNEMQKAALEDWLLDQLEAPELWGLRPEPLSVAQLADRVRHDEDFRAVLDLWMERDDYDLVKALGSLVADEHVPYLPAQRYKPAGLRKRAEWERTWALQRREDAGEKVEIPVPPKYISADFVRPSYWEARGKLDVPKERFISYPKVGRDGDDSELLGWAGWDRLAQAQALAMLYLDRKTQAAWPAHRLLPLLAGLVELEPWLHQWYAAEAPGFPGSPAEFFTDFINGELAQLSSDRSALALLRGVPELS